MESILKRFHEQIDELPIESDIKLQCKLIFEETFVRMRNELGKEKEENSLKSNQLDNLKRSIKEKIGRIQKNVLEFELFSDVGIHALVETIKCFSTSVQLYQQEVNRQNANRVQADASRLLSVVQNQNQVKSLETMIHVMSSEISISFRNDSDTNFLEIGDKLTEVCTKGDNLLLFLNEIQAQKLKMIEKELVYDPSEEALDAITNEPISKSVTEIEKEVRKLVKKFVNANRNKPHLTLEEARNHIVEITGLWKASYDWEVGKCRDDFKAIFKAFERQMKFSNREKKDIWEATRRCNQLREIQGIHQVSLMKSDLAECITQMMSPFQFSVSAIKQIHSFVDVTEKSDLSWYWLSLSEIIKKWKDENFCLMNSTSPLRQLLIDFSATGGELKEKLTNIIKNIGSHGAKIRNFMEEIDISIDEKDASKLQKLLPKSVIQENILEKMKDEMRSICEPIDETLQAIQTILVPEGSHNQNDEMVTEEYRNMQNELVIAYNADRKYRKDVILLEKLNAESENMYKNNCTFKKKLLKFAKVDEPDQITVSSCYVKIEIQKLQTNIAIIRTLLSCLSFWYMDQLDKERRERRRQAVIILDSIQENVEKLSSLLGENSSPSLETLVEELKHISESLENLSEQLSKELKSIPQPVPNENCFNDVISKISQSYHVGQ